jgi:hypothetical protein
MLSIGIELGKTNFIYEHIWGQKLLKTELNILEVIVENQQQLMLLQMELLIYH